MRGKLTTCGFTTKELNEFALSLRYSQRNSVDAFLEHRSEFLRVGKAAIVSALIARENPNELFRIGDWYRYLLSKLNTSFKDFDKNKLAVITFNYDRSLEHYLLTALMHSYGKSQEACTEKVAAIPIIHVHGKMGDLLSAGKRFRDYHHDVHQEAVQLAANEIKIIHEGADGEPQFAEAKKYIAEADVMCFLGFGYDPVNCKRLLPSLTSLHERNIFGSALELTPAEIEGVNDTLGLHNYIKMGTPTQNCLQFLRSHRVLF